MKTALLIIDLQEDFFKDGRLHENRQQLTERVNELVDKAHAQKIPVIWIWQEFKADLSDAPLYNRKNNKPITIQNTKGVQLLSELHREQGDYEVIKKRYSGFFKTELETLLQKLQVDTVIVTGINTMSCVRTTCIDAYQRDYEVILALDGVDGHDKEQHENSIQYLQYAVAKAMRNNEIMEVMK